MAESSHKKVTWAELFFDLVFVLAIVQVTELLGERHQWWGIGRTLVVLLPVYGTWVAATMQENRIGRDIPRDRFGLFGVGLCGLFLAAAIPHAYDDHALFFALSFWAARIVLCLRYLPVNAFKERYPLAATLVITGPLLVVGALVPSDYREGVWAVAVAIDLLLGWLLRERLPLPGYDAGHLTERYGLLVLIALGESIIDISGPLVRDGALVVLEALAVSVAFVLVCTLWWMYFDRFSRHLEEGLKAANNPVTAARFVQYGHLGVVFAIVALAVGLQQMLDDPAKPLTLTHLILLYGGTALFVGSLTSMLWALSREIRNPLLAAFAVVLVLLVVALVIPGIVATALLVVVAVGLLWVDRRPVRRRTRAA